MTSRRRPDSAAPRRRGVWARLGSLLFWTLEAPIAGTVAVGLAAAWLPPRPFWWAQIVAVGLPYAAWGLAAWTLVVAVTRHRRVALVHFALLGAVLWRAAPLAPEPAAPDVLAADDVLRLVSFNVPEQGPSREALGDSMVAFVRATEPHLLALQDAWIFAPSPLPRHRADRNIQLAAVERALPYRARLPDRIEGVQAWRRTGTGVSLLVRDGVDVRAETALPVGQLAQDVTSLATRTEVTWQGRTFALYNTHLRSFGADKPWLNPALRRGALRERLRAALPYLRLYRSVYAARGDEAAALARIVAEDSLPAVVVGDFNSTPDNWSAWRLRTAGVRRADAQRVRGLGWGRTFPARRPLVRIDAVYADPALDVLGAETAPVGFSDHRPVRVWLRWRDRPVPAPADTVSTE